ncbi:hypothetical protein RHK13_08380 [Thermosynechococcus sp. HY591]|nr:hypothetical protein QYC28_08385 [Thermosynechococcus sp. HY596]WNC61971.1 hypothetical protein RHK13_08380 [Thermosynechococcus sp. HY591]
MRTSTLPWRNFSSKDEGFVVIAVRGGVKHFQTLFDRQPRGDDQHVFGETGILRVGHLVQDLPGDDQGHDDGLARTGGHLAALADVLAAIAEDFDTDPLSGGGLGQPDERLHRLQLAEEEAPPVKVFGVGPMFQQPLGDAGDARIARLALGLDARADLVDQRNLDEDARVIEGF